MRDPKQAYQAPQCVPLAVADSHAKVTKSQIENTSYPAGAFSVASPAS